MHARKRERPIDALLTLPRRTKQTLTILVDTALCVLTVWLAICFRFESWVSLSHYQWLAVAVSVLLAIPLLAAFGFYHTVIRYVGKQTIKAALRAIGLYAIIYSAIFAVYGFPLVPRTIGVLQPLLLLVSIALVRLLASQMLSEQVASTKPPRNLPAVLIYGAGSSGQQLAASIQSKGESRVIAFVDDNTSLHNARIAGIPVHHPSDIHQLSRTHAIRDVLLAMPNLSRSKRNDIIKLLSHSQFAVRTLPSLTDLASGKVSEDDLRELDIEDLLGRDPVAPISELMSKCITGKVVLVTGAGGSIGRELCRQIITQHPTHLILIELNEFALYSLLEDLNSRVTSTHIEITPVMCNVLDRAHIDALFAFYKPQTIYHAAAYKHVPLVELNPLAGLKTNVLGTYNVALAALRCDAQDVVMISTDKAVRPTNIMGASKRVAEMLLQGLAQRSKQKESATRICFVRFGNVLGSSGSVVPKFREQIKSGGPITLTHPDIHRYFMTIPEAAQLVIQAGAMHESHKHGAMVYLLDMGQSVKIIDLAKTLIQLNGLRLKDESFPDGDIEIKIIGLRPGEKIYEELLTSGSSSPTHHPKILIGDESHPALERIEGFIQQLASAPTTIDHLAEPIQWARSLNELGVQYCAQSDYGASKLR
jgi:FlaA1/EpsC-like NDP-sugar epimerase